MSSGKTFMSRLIRMQLLKCGCRCYNWCGCSAVAQCIRKSADATSAFNLYIAVTSLKFHSPDMLKTTNARNLRFGETRKETDPEKGPEHMGPNDWIIGNDKSKITSNWASIKKRIGIEIVIKPSSKPNAPKEIFGYK